jgi:NADH dehydrogenase
MASVFLTGGTGFIGRSLLRALRATTHDVICLERGSARSSDGDASSRAVRGDLLDPASYEASLAGVDVVVHLAAVTGRAPEHGYFRVNEGGTAALVEACVRRGVGRFLFVSSIAARFTNAPHYHYARSKQQAERIVRESGLRFTILRPTIVLGSGSPIGKGLRSMSRLPVIPIFGDGRVRVQPIDVGDVAALIVALIDEDRFQGEVIEAGGPDIITMEELLRKLHALQRGSSARTVHLPLVPIRGALGAAERISLALAPITAGQLASFANDGAATPSPFVQSRVADMKRMDEMLTVLARD